MIRANRQQQERMVELYLSGLSLAKASAAEGFLSPAPCRLALNQAGVSIRPAGGWSLKGKPSNNRTYTANDLYFDEVDSEDKAYWLGFLYTDGSLSDRGIVYLSLQRADRGHIELF